MKVADLSIGSRVAYRGLPGRHARKGVITGLASSGRGLRARLLLDDARAIVCPLNLVSAVAGTNGSIKPALKCVRCRLCNRVCGEEWHETTLAALEAAADSGWREIHPGHLVCPECEGEL